MSLGQSLALSILVLTDQNIENEFDKERGEFKLHCTFFISILLIFQHKKLLSSTFSLEHEPPQGEGTECGECTSHGEVL